MRRRRSKRVSEISSVGIQSLVPPIKSRRERECAHFSTSGSAEKRGTVLWKMESIVVVILETIRYGYVL